jgi:hypothetical protein
MAAEPDRAAPQEIALNRNVAFEHSDVSFLRIALVAVGTLAIAGAAALVVAPPFFGLKQHRAEVSPPRSPNAPPGVREPAQPRLEALPETDLQGYNPAYDRVLSSYSWIDRDKGIAAIPLDRAMKIAAERGIPALH